MLDDHSLAASIGGRWGCRVRLVLVILAALLTGSQSVPAAVTIGGSFELAAPDGRMVTDQTFRGRWLLVYFGYTSCPNSCPTTLAAIAKALVLLGPAASRVQPLFITLDPRNDTRAVLNDYTGSFDDRILGLTGSSQQIAAVVKAYGVYVRAHDDVSDSPHPLLDHSGYVYIMRPDGAFDRALDHEPSGEDIANALTAAMSRAAGLGAARDAAGISER